VEAAQSAPHAEEHGPRYPGTCRDRYVSYAEAQAALPPERLPAWRFRAPDREVRFTDGFHGEQAVNVAATTGDFVLARHPLGAGYMLAVVVDDAAMAMDEVLRGDDLLETTPQQLLLYEALGLRAPAFVHVPLVVGPDGRRLAKRHGDTRLASLREAGVPPERVVGLLAHWCGWAGRGEELEAAELPARYRLDRVPAEAVVLASEDRDLLDLDGTPGRP
jgi:glutamyl-tRNA synthetase